MCLVDSATTHTILKDKKIESNVNTIFVTTKIIDGSRRVNVSLCGQTNLYIENALYSPKSHRNLISFKVICIKKYDLDKVCVLEKLPAFSSTLYYTYISTIEAYVIVNQKFTNHDKFVV